MSAEAAETPPRSHGQGASGPLAARAVDLARAVPRASWRQRGESLGTVRRRRRHPSPLRGIHPPEGGADAHLAAQATRSGHPPRPVPGVRAAGARDVLRRLRLRPDPADARPRTTGPGGLTPNATLRRGGATGRQASNAGPSRLPASSVSPEPRAAPRAWPGPRHAVPDVAAPLLAGHQAGLGEHLEVVADRRLALADRLHQVTGTHRAAPGRGQQRHQPQPHRVGERLEQRGHLVSLFLAHRLPGERGAAGQCAGQHRELTRLRHASMLTGVYLKDKNHI